MTTARLVFPALRWGERGPDEVWPEVRRALDLGVGGFVVFGGGVTAMRELVARALDHARRPVLFAADLERGAGQQLAGATPLPPAAALAGLDEAAIAEAARITAREAVAAGIGWVLAPVADLDVEPSNPIVGTRSFGADPAAVAERVAAWVRAAQAEGVHACAKHFPGHGRTTADSHAELPVVDVDRAALAADLTPFGAAVEAGVGSVMLAHVSYPALDPSGAPAGLSPAIVRLLRAELGFGGLVASDALIMDAIAAAGRSEDEAAVEAVRAGCDVVLYPSAPAQTAAALSAALEAGALDRDRVAEAVARVEGAAGAARIDLEAPAPASSRDRALQLAVASIRPLRGAPPEWRAGARLRLNVIDDDAAGPAPGAASSGAAGSEAGRAFARALADRGAHLVDRPGAEAVELIAVFSEVRAWKGRSGLAPATERGLARLLERAPDATVVLFAHPRIADRLPAAAHVLCAWCGDPLMQEAAARRLLAGGRG